MYESSKNIQKVFGGLKKSLKNSMQARLKTLKKS